MSDRDRYELPIPKAQRSKITLDISTGFVGFLDYTLVNYFGFSSIVVLQSEIDFRIAFALFLGKL